MRIAVWIGGYSERLLKIAILVKCMGKQHVPEAYWYNLTYKCLWSSSEGLANENCLVNVWKSLGLWSCQFLPSYIPYCVLRKNDFVFLQIWFWTSGITCICSVSWRIIDVRKLAGHRNWRLPSSATHWWKTGELQNIRLRHIIYNIFSHRTVSQADLHVHE